MLSNSYSGHAECRRQQRGISPLVDELLESYGHETYDGHGGVLVMFDKSSRKQVTRAVGKDALCQLPGWESAYKIRSSHDGTTITVGHRYKRVRRK